MAWISTSVLFYAYLKLYILTELSANDVKFKSVDRQKLDLSKYIYLWYRKFYICRDTAWFYEHKKWHSYLNSAELRDFYVYVTIGVVTLCNVCVICNSNRLHYLTTTQSPPENAHQLNPPARKGVYWEGGGSNLRAKCQSYIHLLLFKRIITTNAICFCHLVKYLKSFFDKQCRPRSDCFFD